MSEAGSGVLQPRKSARSIPSLDGLRAISIGLVIVSHAVGTRGFPSFIPRVLTDHGTLGVQVFFVISGFLITTLLMEERANTGGISLRLFYARRTLRIFPPFYVFLAVIAAGTFIGIFEVPLKNFLFAATYTMNYVTSGFWVTGHIWSLSVEEQFYLVWPWTVKWAGARRAFWIAAAVALGAPLVCLFVYLINRDLGSALPRYFPFVADSIAAGCILCGILPWLRAHERVFRWFAVPAGDLVLPLILVIDLASSHPRIHFAFTETLVNLCICYAIVRYTQFPDCPVGRLLNTPLLSYLGKLSYSLYLWQQIFMNHFGTNVVQSFPLNVALSFCCSLASYYLIELPMMGMRRRLRAPVPMRVAAAAAVLPQAHVRGARR
jgi:peptidoglycan/LPS O-acetylase OafA/YrhL